MTNHYELLYLVAGSYTEEELNPIKNAMGDLVSKHGGNITFEDNFGKKKLAYPVKKNTQGYYLIIEFDLDGEKLKDLNNEVKLTNAILRHVIVTRKPGSAHASLSMSEKIITDGPKRPRVAKRSTSQTSTQIKPKTEDKKEDAKEDEKTQENSEKPKKDSKVNLDDLDEKLDELLEGDIM